MSKVPAIFSRPKNLIDFHEIGWQWSIPGNLSQLFSIECEVAVEVFSDQDKAMTLNRCKLNNMISLISLLHVQVYGLHTQVVIWTICFMINHYQSKQSGRQGLILNLLVNPLHSFRYSGYHMIIPLWECIARVSKRMQRARQKFFQKPFWQS